MHHPGWFLVIIGGLIALVGLAWVFGPSVPWLGRLPGDIVVKREHFRFYFPLATSILLSLLLTGILWLVRWMSR